MNPLPVLHFTGCDGYDAEPPHHPPEAYPELGFLCGATQPGNGVYAGVRETLRALGYDAARFGTPDWSPLSELVPAGGSVVLKPNFVRHYNESPNGSLESVVTHPALLRPLIDYALKAVGPGGRVVVADAPQYDCEIETLLERVRLSALLGFYRDALGIEVPWRDLRVEFGRHEYGVQTEKRALAGDPLGYTAVDLGDASEFTALPGAQVELLRGADYDEEVTIRHHAGGRNEYLVANTILHADLVVNVPKVKTHKKCGLSLSLKNLIGINGDKNWLPHYRTGFAHEGGDEFPRPDAYARVRRLGGEWARQLLKRGLGGPVLRRLRAAENAVGLGARTRAGNWYGNDTIWRTVLDLAKILYLGDRAGALCGPPARRVLNVYDGVVAGEGNGPMGPDARPVGLIAACEDPAAGDAAVAWVLGFDYRRVPLLARALGPLAGELRLFGFDGDPAALPVHCIEAGAARTLPLAELDLDLRFAAHPGWRGRMERERADRAACAS